MSAWQKDKTKIDRIQLPRLNQGREQRYLKYRRRKLWTATSVRTVQTLMEQMVPVALTLLTVHYLPILNAVMTSHHVMKHLIHSCVPYHLKTIKSSLLPDPVCHLLILNYQSHPLPLLHILRHHLLHLKPWSGSSPGTNETRTLKRAGGCRQNWDRPWRWALRQGIVWGGRVNPISCICSTRALGVGKGVKVLNKGKPMFSDEMFKTFSKVLQLH